MKNAPLILLCLLIFSCSKQQSIITNLEQIDAIENQIDLDKYFSKINFKWSGKDYNNASVYKEIGNNNPINMVDTLDRYSISNDHLDKTITFHTTNLAKYLQVVDEAKEKGYKEQQNTTLPMLKDVIGDCYSNGKFTIYCKKETDNNVVFYQISMLSFRK